MDAGLKSIKEFFEKFGQEEAYGRSNEVRVLVLGSFALVYGQLFFPTPGGAGAVELLTDGGLLVDTLNREMLNGSMSPTVRTNIMNAVQAITASDAGLKRARTAVYLVATSPQFQVQR